MEMRGKPVADKIGEEIMARLPVLYERGVVPTVAIVRVGDNPGDIAYENGAIKKAKSLGMQAEKYTCKDDILEEDLIAVIEAINNNDKIHGILLLQPLPKHIDAGKVKNAIKLEKDLDCTSDLALGNLFVGNTNSYAPCTAESVIEILKFYGMKMEGAKATVLGRSLVIGKPVALMLTENNATVTVCHSKTAPCDLENAVKNADIVVSAVGKEKALTQDMCGENQYLIDVGINFTAEGKMVGDIDYELCKDKVSGITPVPGGVGSVTTTVLMRHLLESAEKYLERIKSEEDDGLGLTKVEFNK